MRPRTLSRTEPDRPTQGLGAGVSRSLSNFGSSRGTAIADTILVSGLTDPKQAYALAMIVVGVIGLGGLAATLFIPASEMSATLGNTPDSR